MSKEKIKVYLYTRVSTTMQIDGYSLDAQKKMEAFCDYNEYEIVGEYDDAGFWGESDLCGGRNRFIQRCREAYDICSNKEMSRQPET